jgi:hypothetical protein
MGAGEVSPNPELYARMAVPYETADAAQTAIKAFLADVAALREKHRIAEVAIIAGAYVPAPAWYADLVAMTQTLGDQGRSMQLVASLGKRCMLNEAERREEEAEDLRRRAAEIA